MSLKSKSGVKEKIKTNFWNKWTVDSINTQQWTFEEKKKTSPKKGPQTPTLPTINYFADNEIVILPDEYQTRISAWKRPIELFPQASIIDIENYVGLFGSPMTVDLFKYNLHLQGCVYYTHIMNAIEGLCMYPRWNSVDFEEFGFTKWEPLNHIYSITKITPGLPHVPEFNKYGKYIVRLYHCGKWRALTIDDRIPVDRNNVILLPCLKHEQKIDVWLLLLVKAILKLNEYRKEDINYYQSLNAGDTAGCNDEVKICCYCDRGDIATNATPNSERNLFDKLNVVTMLTGWNPIKTTFFDNNEEEIWNYLHEQIEVFKYPTKPKKGEIIEQPEFHFIMMQLEFQDKSNFELSLLTIREIPIFQKPPKPELSPWKHYRWLDWALEHGYHVIDPPDSYHSLAFTIGQSRIEMIDKYFESDWYQTQLKPPPPAKGKKGGKGNKSSSKMSSKISTKTKSMSSGHSSNTLSTPGGVTLPPIIKLPIWLKFNLIKESIKTLVVFNRNSQYKYNIFITNEPVEVISKKADGKKSAKNLKAPEVIVDEKATIVQEFIFSKTNYVYIFLDNLLDILAVITLTNMKLYGTEYGNVVCEAMHWDCNERFKFFEIKLLNQSCERIIFPKGRHIYRLEIQLNNYNIHIQTNGLIKICNDYELFTQMAERPLRFVDYYNQLAEKFKLLIDNIGTNDYTTFMQLFYQQILYYFNPRQLPAVKNYWIYEIFLENFIKLHKNLLQKLFLYKYWMHNSDLDFCYNKKVCLNMMMIYNQINSKEYTCECSITKDGRVSVVNAIDVNKSKYFDKYFNFIVNNYAATKIQTIFKMYFIQLLIKNYHKAIILGDPTIAPNTIDKFQMNKEYLIDFYDIYFLQNAESVYDFLLNGFFNKMLPNNAELLSYYNFNIDMAKNYVNLYELNGLIKVLTINKINLLLQGCFTCHKKDENDDSFYFIKFSFIDLKTPNVVYFLKILNNDTNEEIYINRNNLTRIFPNNSGYTIIIYYFVSSKQVQVRTAAQAQASLLLTNVKWRLYIVSRYNVERLHLCKLCRFIKHTMLSCKCPSEIDRMNTERLNSNTEINCDTKDLKYYINDMNYTMYWPNTSKQLLRYNLLVGDNNTLTLFFSTSNLNLYFNIKIWATVTEEIIFEGQYKGFVALLALCLTNEQKEPSAEKLTKVPSSTTDKTKGKGGKSSGKGSGKGSAKTPKGGAANKAALLEKLEMEKYKNWIENPINSTEYCLTIELCDQWKLSDMERLNIHNSQHELIDELIRNEDEEALHGEGEYEQDGKGDFKKVSKEPHSPKAPNIPFEIPPIYNHPYTSTDDYEVDKPYWNIQINYPQNSLILVQPDRKIEDNIIEVKKKWKQNGFLDIGEYARNDFLYNQQKLIENFMDPCSCINSRSKEIFVTNYQYENIGSSMVTVADEMKSSNEFEEMHEEKSENNVSNDLSLKLEPFCLIYDRLADIIMKKVYPKS